MGRKGLYELFLPTEDTRRLMIAKASSAEIRKSATENGMKTLYQDGIEKVKKGITTAEELKRVIQEM